MPRISTDYWTYSNGTCEVRSTKEKPCLRHIAGPIPESDLRSLVQTPDPINPSSPTWQKDLTDRLASAHFHIESIAFKAPNPAHISIGSYIRHFSSEDKLFSAQLGFLTLTAIAPLSFFNSSLRVSLPSHGLSERLFTDLTGAIGSKSFPLWWQEKMKIFFRDPNEAIPATFESDPVLSQNICPITARPIRMPCQTPSGYLFEETALKTWILQKGRCPITQDPIHITDLSIDRIRSDQIELRLLLLKSHK